MHELVDDRPRLGAVGYADQRHHLLREPDNRARSGRGATRRWPRRWRSAPAPYCVSVRASSSLSDRVQPGDHDDQATIDVPAQGGEVVDHDLGRAGPVQQHLADEVAAVLRLDRLHRHRLGDRQRQHGRRPLEHVQVTRARAAPRRGAPPADHGRFVPAITATTAIEPSGSACSPGANRSDRNRPDSTNSSGRMARRAPLPRLRPRAPVRRCVVTRVDPPMLSCSAETSSSSPPPCSTTDTRRWSTVSPRTSTVD